MDAPQDRKFVNPMQFIEDDCPIIVLVDDLRGGLGWAIKAHTAGNYCHAMTLYHAGILASQNWLFQTLGLDQYLKPSLMLKFWRIKGLTPAEKLAIQTAIYHRLMLPWWKRTYDFIGTFVGQLVRVKWLQNPMQEFCSEEVNDDYVAPVKKIRQFSSEGILADQGISKMVINEPSPSELDRIFKLHPDLMECLGYWWAD